MCLKTRNISCKVSSTSDVIPIEHFGMSIIPIEYDDEPVCVDCVWFDCENHGTGHEPVYPCCTGACGLDSCPNWNNCELCVDLGNDLSTIRTNINGLMEEKNDLERFMKTCRGELDKLWDGEYDGETNALGEPISCLSDIFYGVEYNDLELRKAEILENIRRWRGLEFEELKRLRNNKIRLLW